MKKINLLTIILLGAVIFSSCKSGMDLTKRRYNKGYYVHKTHQLKTDKTIAIDPVASKEELASNDMPQLTASLPKPAVSDLKPILKQEVPVVEAPSKVSVNESTEESSAGQSVNSQKQNEHKKSVTKKQKKGGSDANTILLVILCLFPFICLIAVYLHDGKSITMNFWITLLLHLTFIGYIIFSILVVLDVVNLA